MKMKENPPSFKKMLDFVMPFSQASRPQTGVTRPSTGVPSRGIRPMSAIRPGSAYTFNKKGLFAQRRPVGYSKEEL